MTSEAFDRALNVLSSRMPFRPFTVEFNTGQRYEIDHPRALAYRDGLAMFAAPGGVPVLFDHESVNQFIGDLSQPSK